MSKPRRAWNEAEHRLIVAAADKVESGEWTRYRAGKKLLGIMPYRTESGIQGAIVYELNKRKAAK